MHRQVRSKGASTACSIERSDGVDIHDERHEPAVSADSAERSTAAIERGREDMLVVVAHRKHVAHAKAKM
jgi:hypothetical protein